MKTMKQVLILGLVGSLALASCTKQNAPDITGKSVTKTFTNMQVTGYTAAAGTAKYVDLTGGDRLTTLSATGLKANTSYVAHYHAQGSASTTDPCKSAGPIVGGVIGMPMTSDASGKLTIKGVQATADLGTAKYINIHEAAALSVVPLCAPL